MSINSFWLLAERRDRRIAMWNNIEKPRDRIGGGRKAKREYYEENKRDTPIKAHRKAQ